MSPSSYSSDAEFRGNNDVEAASRYLGEAMGGGGEVGRRVLERSGTDEELGRIAQAMVFCPISMSWKYFFFLFFFFPFFLLSPLALPHSFFANIDHGEQKTLLSLHPTGASAGVQFHPPTAFGSAPSPSTGPTSWPSPEELLKESLRQSLSALHALGRIKSLVDNLPDSGEKDEKEGERGIAQIMGFYDRAVGEMKAAGEVLVLTQPFVRERDIRLPSPYKTNFVGSVRIDLGSAVSG